MKALLHFIGVTTLLGQTFAQHYDFSIHNWNGVLDQDLGVLRSLHPTSDDLFDFSPSDFFDLRNASGSHNTGDITFMYRVDGDTTWSSADSSLNKTALVSHAVGKDSDVLLETNLSNAWPNISSTLDVVRTWQEKDGDLVLNFSITNIHSSQVELGALGFPITFNNIFSTRTAEAVTNRCVLLDPYIGLDAGYVQVTRLTGTGPDMVITPADKSSKFEAWNFLTEPSLPPLYYQSQTYEGNYAWQVYTKALAETAWSGADPWNNPTSVMIASNQTMSWALRFTVSKSVQDIEDTISSLGFPLAVGIPGYVIPHDLTGKLFLNSKQSVDHFTIEPAGALRLSPRGKARDQSWKSYDVVTSPSAFGRTRLTINYSDGLTQTVFYYVVASGPSAMQTAGEFLTTKQWYTNTSDPFGRAPAVISYNRLTNYYALQDDRTWIPGLSDEGGAGSFVTAGMKQYALRNAGEVHKLETMVNKVVWGTLQNFKEPKRYGVQRSVFFYQPKAVPSYQYNSSINWDGSWSKKDALEIWRTYDYVHVSALYWSLYKAGRMVPGILKQRTPMWYLNQAYETVMFAVGSNAAGNANTDYSDVGLMGETVWMQLLQDLENEGLSEKAKNFTALMLAREKIWAGQADPYGSEMAWDSTGEEGVYLWAAYFNNTALVDKTLRYIRGYMPTVAHWGWNGNARRYWDFLYAGELPRIERMLHHYGSGLNSLPLLSNYRTRPDPTSKQALYDLRVGYGGNMGPLTNLQSDGCASMAFHSYMDTLQWDYYTGDYGPNFLGHTLGAATYLVNHPTFGWISMGGNWKEAHDGSITVQPRDTVRRQIFVAELGTLVGVESGTIESFTFDPMSGDLTVDITRNVPGLATRLNQTILSLDQPSDVLRGKKIVLASPRLKKAPGGYILPFKRSGSTRIYVKKS